uniref:Uncharacterized protein n=1 Tax=Anguilla anguilla TaxID=7936 RepID=A0A0E9W4J7_ANGAN
MFWPHEVMLHIQIIKFCKNCLFFLLF